MTTWVALFRAVNLGPTNRLPMSDLRAILEGLGYESVRTHLQSGNALFATTGATAKDLERAIRARVEREAGLSVPVLVRSTKELDAVVAATRDGTRSATVSISAVITPKQNPAGFAAVRKAYELAVCAALAR